MDGEKGKVEDSKGHKSFHYIYIYIYILEAQRHERGLHRNHHLECCKAFWSYFVWCVNWVIKHRNLPFYFSLFWILKHSNLERKKLKKFRERWSVLWFKIPFIYGIPKIWKSKQRNTIHLWNKIYGIKYIFETTEANYWHPILQPAFNLTWRVKG